MRAGPRPEVAVKFIAEPPASAEFRVQQGLRDLLSLVARFGDGRVSRDVARDLRDLAVVKRRATARLVHPTPAASMSASERPARRIRPAMRVISVFREPSGIASSSAAAGSFGA